MLMSFFVVRDECLYQFSDILTHFMSIYVSGSRLFLSFSLNICNNDRLYYHCTCICPFLEACVSLSFLMAISVFGYIVTDCNSIGTSIYPPLCVSVSVCGYHINNFACIGTSLGSYFFLSHSV